MKKVTKVLIVIVLLLVSLSAISCDGKPPIKSMRCVNHCGYQFNYARAQIGMRRKCPNCGFTNILQ